MYHGCSDIVPRSRSHHDDPSRPQRAAGEGAVRARSKRNHGSELISLFRGLTDNLAALNAAQLLQYASNGGKGMGNKGSTRKEK